MKKFLCFVISMVILLTFVACDDETVDIVSGNNEVIVIGYAQVGAESAWRIANTDSFQATFGDHPEKYDFRFVNCQNKPEYQIEAVSDFIAQEVDYIVIAPMEESGWDEILGEAKEAGIPVIVSDRMINTEDDSLYVAWVGSNFQKEGQDCMTWLNNYLVEIGRDTETVNIFHMQGSMGSSAQIGRTEGITQGIEENGNLVLKEQETGEFTMAKGEEVMVAWLELYNASDIDVLIAENDDMALGAIKAMERVGIIPGVDIIIIGFDAGEAAFDAVIAGAMNCTVECNPLQGPRVEEIILMLEDGKTPSSKLQYIEEGIFDIKNAQQARDAGTRHY